MEDSLYTELKASVSENISIRTFQCALYTKWYEYFNRDLNFFLNIIFYIFQGFTSDYSRNNIQELEEELNEYDAKIVTILEQLEKSLYFSLIIFYFLY